MVMAPAITWTHVLPSGLAWRRPGSATDEPLYHVVGRTIKRRMETDEMELQAVNECMDTALLERWDVEKQVVVMTDNIYALQAIKDWSVLGSSCLTTPSFLNNSSFQDP